MKAVSFDLRLKTKYSCKSVSATVHSVFDKAINLKFPDDDRLLTVCTDVFNRPGTILVKEIPQNERRGAEVRLNWPSLSLKNSKVDMKGAVPWTEVFIPEGGKATSLAVFRRRKNELAEKVFGSELTELRKNISLRQKRKLIGVGEGLTPAGDDYLSGSLNSSFYEKKIFPCEETKKNWLSLCSLVRNSLQETNDISRSFLLYALAGRLGEREIRLLNGIGSSFSKSTPEHLTNAFLKWGATSGKYQLFGLLDLQGNF